MSPRRSSRARSSQNGPSAPPHTNSSSSTATTAKDNRNTRLSNTTIRPTSPGRRASTVRSESIDDAESGARAPDGVGGPRRSRRGEIENNNNNNKKSNSALEDDDDEAEDAQEEDVTRCICGRPEYPGPGASVKEQLSTGESISDDVGNFFVQCDKCHVWQHGGCMGLTDETMLPDEYYCETCKPELHRVIKTGNGPRSSRYLPVLERAVSDGSSPLSSAGEQSRKNSTKSKTSESTKRRATMNSRGAYDEDEMLRRAIEESREMGTLKRSRDDDVDHNQIVKRQRTGSSSASSFSRRSPTPQPTVEETLTRSTSGGSRSNNANLSATNKLRGVVAKTNKEKEIRDKQKEALASQRAEAASKRNARSERRRGEDSPPPTPSLSPSKPPAVLAKPPRTVKDATPPAKQPVNRKGGRPPARRGRLGRNQYTRDLPLNGDTSDSPLRDTSRDPHAVDSPRPHTGGNGHRDGINGESGRSSKAKTHPARTSMNEMKRRVAAILEFVGRMQNERRGRSSSKSTSDLNGGTGGGGGSRSSGSGSSSLKGNSTPNGSDLPIGANADLVKAITEGLENADQANTRAGNGDSNLNGDGNSGEDSDEMMVKVELVPEKAFAQMNSMEMMETLSGELAKWQSVYGVYAR